MPIMLPLDSVDTKRRRHGERLERARLDARSAARDLLRLVRALDARGVKLDELELEHRKALETCNHELATALSAVSETPEADRGLERVESSLADARARLAATREAILAALGRKGRLAVLEAMLAVEVVDEDLQVEATPEGGGPGADEVEAARIRAEKRWADRERQERLRRKVEARAVDVHAPALKLLGNLPKPWREAVRAHSGARDADGAELVKALTTPDRLAAIVSGLRRGDRAALRTLLDAHGLVHARAIESRWGDVTEDGYAWDLDPPTSVLGRLRARGLVVVGRATIGPNPRSRPRVFLVPSDLRRALSEAMAQASAAPTAQGPITPECIEAIMDDADQTDEAAEAESVRFDREQPELATFAAEIADAVSEEVGPGPVLYCITRVWGMFDAAYPGVVPRLRASDLLAARNGSRADLAAVDVIHGRLLERRVGRMVARQPHVYACIASLLDDLDWAEEDKLVVFHACDTVVRAFDRAM
jgi:hypothetical protein